MRCDQKFYLHAWHHIEKRNTMRSNLNLLFNPEGVAVIGASNNPAKVGGMTLLSIVSGGFKGEIYPINQREEEIFGFRAYKNVKDVPRKIDLAVICVPASSVKDVLRECVEKGVKFGVIISSGFGEAGGEGRALEREAVKIANDGGMRIVGPNCMGMANSDIKLYALMNMLIPKEGKVSIVSQSGTLGSLTMALASDQGVGFNKFASSGNEADLHAEDFIEYFAQDPKTEVILVFIEGLRDGRKFLKVANEATGNKPLVILKGGITEEGAKAASSHTGSMAGSAPIYEAAFKQTGVIRAFDGEDLIDLAKGFALLPLPKGRRVGMVSAWGGIAVLASDSCARHGLKLPELSKDAMEKLDNLLPPFWSRRNPIDITSAGIYGSWEIFIETTELLLRDDGIDAVICMIPIFTPIFTSAFSRTTQYKDYTENVLQFTEEMEREFMKDFIRLRGYGKPLIVLSFFEGRESESVKTLEENGIPVYRTPEKAAHVLSMLAKYKEYLTDLDVKSR